MAESLRFRVVSEDGELLARCKRAEEAAAVVSVISEGKVLYGRKLVWLEGDEHIEASESYDEAAAVMWNRIDRVV